MGRAANGTILDMLAIAGMPQLLDCAIRAALLLALVGGATLCLRRSSAAVRHFVWLLGLGVLLALPAHSLLPGWNVLPRWVSPVSWNTRSTADFPEYRLSKSRLAESGSGGHSSSESNWPSIEVPAIDHSGLARAGVDRLDPENGAAVRSLVMRVWMIGCLLALLPCVIGFVSLWRLGRRSVRVSEGPLATLLGRMSARLGIRRRVRLLVSRKRAMPMQWGIVFPTVLLPVSASTWPEDRVSAVLLHELAHVRRRDCLSQFVVRLVGAVYWFHPVVWWAIRQLQAESEMACDETTLNAGCHPTDYAEHLLHVAAHSRTGLLLAMGAIGMARRSRLEQRVRAILDRKQNRQRLTTTGVMASIALVTAIALPLAVLRGQPADAAVAAESGARPEPPVANSGLADESALIRLGYVDDTAEGRRSLAGSGHAVRFQRPDGDLFLVAVELFASRYGYAQPPDEDFHIYLLDEHQELVGAWPFPYAMIERGDPHWYTLKIPACKVPQQFYVALTFNPHSTKGVYVGLDESVTQSHSYVGRPTQGYQKTAGNYDWMVRAILVHDFPASNPFDHSENRHNTGGPP